MIFSFKNVLKVLAIPLSLIAVYFSLLLLWKFFDLPAPAELEGIIRGYFEQYGLWIVFVCALLEGLLLVGQYFPGGIVIFLGVIAAGEDVPRVIEVVFTVMLAFNIIHSVNYSLGRYGWYRLFLKFGLKTTLEGAERKLSRHIGLATLSNYWSPSLAAITATAAGVLHLPPKTFLMYSFISITLWCTFWGVVVFFTGNALLQLSLSYILLIFALWCGMILLTVFVFNRRRKNSLTE